MLSYNWCIYTFVALFSATCSIAATLEEKLSQTIVVDPSGRGGCRSIQAAIDSISSNNKTWTVLDIREGVYREKVKIPSDKPYIYLKGAGRRSTVIQWNAYGSIETSATFTSEADHTIARGITFVNSYNYPANANPNRVDVAVAALIKGDKSAFYRCRFFGLQDTLWDVQGRHYFKSCTIEGAIDFIFGSAQSLYEGCTISVAAGGLKGTLGFITAQGRESPQDTGGFVFKECNIVGNGKAFLGRPWRDYARVLFYNTKMSDVVVPQGWYLWNSAGHEGQLTLSEYNSQGEGAKSSERVKWAKKLSEREAQQLSSMSFVDEDGWINQAVNMLGA